MGKYKINKRTGKFDLVGNGSGDLPEGFYADYLDTKTTAYNSLEAQKGRRVNNLNQYGKVEMFRVYYERNGATGREVQFGLLFRREYDILAVANFTIMLGYAESKGGEYCDFLFKSKYERDGFSVIDAIKICRCKIATGTGPNMGYYIVYMDASSKWDSVSYDMGARYGDNMPSGGCNYDYINTRFVLPDPSVGIPVMATKFDQTGGVMKAEDVSFDDSVIGSGAKTVQEVIEKSVFLMNDELGYLNEELNKLKNASELVINSAENVAYGTSNVKSELDITNTILDGYKGSGVPSSSWEELNMTDSVLLDGWWIDPGAKWNQWSVASLFYIAIPSKSSKIKINANPEYATYYAIVKEIGTPTNRASMSLAEGYTDRAYVLKGESVELNFGDDAKFLIYSKSSNGTYNQIPSSIEVYREGESTTRKVSDDIEELRNEISDISIGSKYPDLSVNFGTPSQSIRMFGTTDGNSDDSKIINSGQLITINGVHYCFYLGMPTSGSDENSYHILSAYSTDGTTWQRGFPSGVNPPVEGTARLFNEGGLIEHCVVKVNDANYPYRLICNKFHSSSSQTMRMYKSNDGIHYSFMRDILSEKHDAQISAINRGNSIKIYTRIWDSAHTNRQIGVMYIDLEGNITTKLHIALGNNLYAASASQIDLDRELLLPTWYIGVNTSTQQDAHLECYVMDGEKSKKLDTNINQVMKSDEYWALFCSGMISVNGQQYVAMNVWKRHHYAISGDVQQCETRLVPISVEKA